MRSRRLRRLISACRSAPIMVRECSKLTYPVRRNASAMGCCVVRGGSDTPDVLRSEDAAALSEDGARSNLRQSRHAEAHSYPYRHRRRSQGKS